MTEPNYMSRTEMLEKLAQLSHVQDVAHLEAMTAMIHGDDEVEVDESFGSEPSEVSTVKQNESGRESGRSPFHSRSVGNTEYSGGYSGSEHYSGSECSCESCAVSYSSCSCCEDEEEEANLTSLTSSGIIHKPRGQLRGEGESAK